MKGIGINKQGEYFISKFRNSMSRSFTREKKGDLITDKKVCPGPGHYQLTKITDFGFYHKMDKYRKTTTDASAFAFGTKSKKYKKKARKVKKIKAKRLVKKRDLSI